MKSKGCEMNTSEIRMRELKNHAKVISKKTAHIHTGEKDKKKINEYKTKIMQYFQVGEDEWRDWKWQMKSRITDALSLDRIFGIEPEKIREISKVEKEYPWSVSPFYLSLIGEDTVENPLFRMCIPDIAELLDMEGTMDPMNENMLCPAGRITRRYPDRLILNITNECGSYCRFCQRKRNIRKNPTEITMEDLEESIQYIRDNKEISDVLITGGDPLTLSDKRLQEILEAVRRIEHVQIIRLGTRMPIYIPMRITTELCDILKKFSPLYINVHINHPLEINEESSQAILKLVESGIPISNQMVLLRGVNDNPYEVLVLNRELLKIKVRPYYMFHPKSVKSTMHFQCSIRQGLKIMELLRGRLSGLAIPTYVINSNGGLGKVPLLPNYLLNYDESGISLRTWEGKVIHQDIKN